MQSARRLATQPDGVPDSPQKPTLAIRAFVLCGFIYWISGLQLVKGREDAKIEDRNSLPIFRWFSYSSFCLLSGSTMSGNGDASSPAHSFLFTQLHRYLQDESVGGQLLRPLAADL
jgi:hypothetical protein